MTHHTGHLRRYVSAPRGRPEPVIAGALLSRLDRHGANLRWVDAVGAHTCRVDFPASAEGPGRRGPDAARPLERGAARVAGPADTVKRQ
jgi:hypothetical protein